MPRYGERTLPPTFDLFKHFTFNRGSPANYQQHAGNFNDMFIMSYRNFDDTGQISASPIFRLEVCVSVTLAAALLSGYWPSVTIIAGCSLVTLPTPRVVQTLTGVTRC